jgi:hypothetical protein
MANYYTARAKSSSLTFFVEAKDWAKLGAVRSHGDENHPRDVSADWLAGLAGRESPLISRWRAAWKMFPTGTEGRSHLSLSSVV